MIGTLSFAGASAAACGYDTYSRMRKTSNALSKERQISAFRAAHGLTEPEVKNSTEAQAITLPVSPRRPAVSFDFLNTLVGQSLPKPEDIFDIVESRLGVTGFAEARKRAGKIFCNDRCLGGIAEIYQHLASDKNLTFDLQRIRDTEWEVELEHTVLIKSNVDKLVATPPGTSIIIVSDSIYDAEKIREMLASLKFPRLDEVAIFSSRKGKADGWVWSILNEIYDIVSYTGSDKNESVPVKLIHDQMASAPIAGETLMFSLAKTTAVGPERQLGSVIRRLSLANPYSFETQREKFFYYRIHAAYSVPLISYFLESLRRVLDSDPLLTRVVTMSRSGFLAEMIARNLLENRGVFTTSKGEERAITLGKLETSKRLLTTQLKLPNEDYLNYLKECLGEEMATATLLVDLNGSYAQFAELAKKSFAAIPKAHFLTIQGASVPTALRGILTVAIPGIDTDILNLMIPTCSGLLVDWRGSRSEPFGGPVRTLCEFTAESLEVARYIFDEIAPQVLTKSTIFPHSRSMSALLQKATNSLGGNLGSTGPPVTLQSLIYPSRTDDSQRTVELAQLYASLLTRYHDSSATILDASTRSTIPWERFMGKHVNLVSDSESVADLVVLTAPDLAAAGSLISEYGNRTKSLLSVHVVNSEQEQAVDPKLEGASLVAKWRLKAGSTLPAGVLLVFEKRRMATAATEDDLPDVPTM